MDSSPFILIQSIPAINNVTEGSLTMYTLI